ncbi:MAG TPA: HdeD family acid-resistance protein [Candidatus Limnocylindrales bacterium]|nr:HdeD family acid-resistance protein [Candidatus Limnocylindrales bacterium]
MLDLVTRNWWLFAIRGIAAIIFGVLAFLWPGPTVVVLVALFGAYALVDGASMLVSLVRGEPGARRHAWAVAIMGLLGIAAGIITFFVPGWTAVTLVYVVAFWSIALGVFQIAAAIRLRREIEGELWMAIGGILAILFGVYLAVFPGAGLISLVWLVGAWAILFGISNLVFAWRARELKAGGALNVAGHA